MINLYSPTIKKFKENKAGRDYVVGDIHGRFDLLDSSLNAINFKKTTDRLFSVGDLINRGELSYRAQEYLNYPYFHAVRGNHENELIDFMFHDIKQNDMDGNLFVLDDYKPYTKWFHSLNSEEQLAIVNSLRQLPIVIEIEMAQNKKAGILHAEVPSSYYNWDSFCTDISKGYSNLINSSIWGRTKIREKYFFSDIAFSVLGIDYIYVGHSIVENPKKLGNNFYIDTGAFSNNTISIFEIGASIENVQQIIINEGVLNISLLT